jgi:hypothetical protein
MSDDNRTNPDLSIKTIKDLGDGRYTSVEKGVAACELLFFNATGPTGECANTPREGTTELTYFYAATLSYDPKKQDELPFISHYAEVLREDGSVTDLGKLHDKETTTSTCRYDQHHDLLFCNTAGFLDISDTIPLTISGAHVYAKSQSGCGEFAASLF